MDGQSNKFLAALLLLLLTLTSTIQSSFAARPAAATTSIRFIKASCSTTTYPRLCYDSLSSQATAIRQDPKLLADAALSVSLNSARSTAAEIVKISHSSGMSPREVGAIQDCVDELSDSVDQLRNSMAEMNQIKGPNFYAKMSDIQTWVSAALTDEDTCTDGFSGKATNGGIKTAIRARIVEVAHLTSNALALINSYASRS